MREPTVYMLASKRNGTIYTGVTSNLGKRLSEHRDGMGSEFAFKYGCKILVYYESFFDMESAIRREKQLKKWRREWKIALIEKINPVWEDLHEKRANLDPGFQEKLTLLAHANR